MRTGASAVAAPRRGVQLLRESEEQWREVFEHNPVMHFMIGAAGTVLSVNTFDVGDIATGVRIQRSP
jgi:hypothetical protein